METLRKPFQGVYNILRFNWHFYAIAVSLLVIVYTIDKTFKGSFNLIATIVYFFIIIPSLLSLFISFYIYDISGLYKLDWLDKNSGSDQIILNIHAGFDETSHLLNAKYSQANLLVFDFYDPKKHTEVSIIRARKAYSVYPGTQSVSTRSLPLKTNYADKIFLIFAAHEVRNQSERVDFFKEIYRVLKPGSKLFVIEHLRDRANFFAYNLGFFHFFPVSEWYKTFQNADFEIIENSKITPFVTVFKLQKNGTSS